jgi:CRISPR-associated protein Csm3
MQLKNIQQLQGRITLLSGLRIGASEGEIRIGGIDNQVIRHPHTNEPYIPGSSIKGKVRSLLEWRSGAVRSEPLGLKDLRARSPEISEQVKLILQLFGVGGGDQLSEEQAAEIGPTRLAFWDAALQPEWTREIEERNLLLTEAKTENSIDRIKGTAEHPRQTERVPAGARFDFKLSIKVLDIDGDGSRLMNAVLAGLKLLERDSLGGSGSRGYGKVRFEGLSLDGADVQSRFEATDPFAA